MLEREIESALAADLRQVKHRLEHLLLDLAEIDHQADKRHAEIMAALQAITPHQVDESVP